MDERDASNAGVRPGGLVNQTEIRILVCYLLSNFNEPVPESQMQETLHYTGMVNYFEVGEAIAELAEYGHITPVEIDGEKMYTVTETGSAIAKELETSVPRSVRERTKTAISKMLARHRIEKETKIEITRAEKGCIVSCSYMEGDIETLTIRIQVADEHEAFRVREHFLENALDIYLKTHEAMTGYSLS